MISPANKKVINSLFLVEECPKIEAKHFKILEQENGSDFYEDTILKFSGLLRMLQSNQRTVNAVSYAYKSKNKELIGIFRTSCQVLCENGNLSFARFANLAKDYIIFDTALKLVKNVDALSNIISTLPTDYIDRALKVLQKAKHKLFFELCFLGRFLTKEQQSICIDGLTKEKLGSHFATAFGFNVHNNNCDAVAKKLYQLDFNTSGIRKNTKLTLSLCVQYLDDLDRFGNKHRLRLEILGADATKATLQTKVYVVAVLTKLGFETKEIEFIASIK